MDIDPLRILTSQQGFFTRREATEAGYHDRDIARQVRTGVWLRFRHGCYAFTDEWAALDAVARHRIRASAVMRSLGDAVALSHVSGVVRRGDIDVWNLPLDKVHVTRLDGGAGRIEGDVVHHEGFATADDVERVDGVQVLRAERCVLETASRADNETALCLIDSGLRAKAFDEVALRAQHDLMSAWPYMRHLHIPVRMADGRSGSVGESRGRWLFWAGGLPAPVLQYEVRDSAGNLIGVVDWAWPDRGVLGEFDGYVKYGRLLRPGQSPGDAVFEEKRREDRLRELTGFVMIRLIWDDYAYALTTHDRIARALRIAG